MIEGRKFQNSKVLITNQEIKMASLFTKSDVNRRVFGRIRDKLRKRRRTTIYSWAVKMNYFLFGGNSVTRNNARKKPVYFVSGARADEWYIVCHLLIIVSIGVQLATKTNLQGPVAQKPIITNPGLNV